jgi:hypothetical protein
MSYKQPLGKGGKIVQKKAEESAPARVLAWNRGCVESLQQRVLSGRGIPYDAHSLVTDILGTGDDGQFYIGIENRRIIRQDNLLIVQKSKTKCIVPTRFLKNPAKKNAKIICPDLLKVGAYVSCYMAAGVQMTEIDIGYGGAYDAPKTYVQMEYVLSAEKEEEWGTLGVCQSVAAEIKKLMKENALIPEEKRKPAELILENYGRNFQKLQESTAVFL